MSKYKGTSSDRCQRAPKLTPGNARVLTGSRASQSLCLPFQEQETETGNRTQSNYENSEFHSGSLLFSIIDKETEHRVIMKTANFMQDLYSFRSSAYHIDP
ncbi:MAG: hypothetical protein ACI97B_004399, partial [Verrucomicrobiales bacterium]